MSPARKRLAWLFVTVGAGMIVEHTLASGDDVAQPVAAATAPAHVATAATLEPDATPAAHPPGGKGAAATTPSLHLELLAPRRAEDPASAASQPGGDTLFAVQSWLPPAPPPPPPPPPTAPAFPYTYVGGLTDETGRADFFSLGDRMLTLHAGDIVDGAWHVDQLDDQQMTLTYVPLKQTRVVRTRGGR